MRTQSGQKANERSRIRHPTGPGTRSGCRASRIIEGYERATSVEARGAAMLGDEMIDEASHKMARAIVAKGRAAGLTAS